MDDIQSWWEVPSIAHFCSLFRVAFNLLDFDIEELEEALLTDGTEDCGSSLLQELIVRLLCGIVGNNGISTFNYQMFLRRLFRQKCREYGRENPFNTDIDFQFLPLRTKVEILHALCDFRLDADDVLDVLKNLDSDSLRVHPLGYDENRSAYWYFYGTRLYREDYPKAKKKKKKPREREKAETKGGRGGKRRGRGVVTDDDGNSDDTSEAEGGGGGEMGLGQWQVVCYTEADWEQLAHDMADSRCKEERALHAVLNDDFLPEIPRLFEEKERLQRKRLMEMQPRRQSSRIEKLKHQKEEEKLRQAKLEKLERQRLERLKQEKEEKKDSASSRATRAMMRSRSSSECDGSLVGVAGGVEGGGEGGGTAPESGGGDHRPQGHGQGRQTNNSLASATGQIIIHQHPSRQKLKTSQVFRQSDEDVRTGLYKILDRLKNHDDAWPFVDPVEEEYAPRYYSVIARPMDLQRMEDKLDAGQYRSFGQFKADFQLIIDNCRQYNGSDNEYTEMASKLQEAFESAVERYLEVEVSTDEEVAVEFQGGGGGDPKAGGGRKRKGSEPREPRSPSESLPARSDDSDEDLDRDLDRDDDRDRDNAKDESGSDGGTSQTSGERRSRKRRRPGWQQKKGGGALKNVVAFDALELATEQTLKDISKWLDDTPRFSEFSSASNSPSQSQTMTTAAAAVALEDSDVAARIENDYRNRLKLDRPPRPRDYNRESQRRRLMKEQGFIKRRREIHRTIDRLQPGKSKGNLLSNLTTSKNNEETSVTANKDQKSSLTDVDESAPKLSLGTVLTSDVIGFGKHNFGENESRKENIDFLDDSNDDKKLVILDEDKKSPDSCVKSEDVVDPPDEKKVKCEEEEEKKPLLTVKKKPVVAESGGGNCGGGAKQAPNLSAWFKAFGAPKSQPTVKKKPEEARPISVLEESSKPSPRPEKVVKEDDVVVVEEVERKVAVAVVPPLQSPARRQRKASTGSSVSERSSFSQDPNDPMIDGSSPRPSLDEPYLSPQSEPMKTPYHHSPVNGTIRVGFYQDTSFPRSNSSSSPRDPPSCSPRDPPSCSPRDHPDCSPHSYSPKHPVPSPKTTDYRSPFTPSTLPNYSAPVVTTSSAVCETPLYEAPLSPFPAHMPYYDTNKPIIEQYRSTVPVAPAPVQQELPPKPQRLPTPPPVQAPAVEKCMFPVKKRGYSDVESIQHHQLQLQQQQQQQQKAVEEVPPPVTISEPYRGGSFAPTRGAVEQDRAFTPTPGRMPTSHAPTPVHHAYPPEATLNLGLSHHTLPPPRHPLDRFTDERLLQAPFFGADYSKTVRSAEQLMYPQTHASTTPTTSYPGKEPCHQYPGRPDLSEVTVPADYNRPPQTLSYPDPRAMKPSEVVTPGYNTGGRTSPSVTALNYSRTSDSRSPSAINPSSPLNFSNADKRMTDTVITSSSSSPVTYMTRPQDLKRMPPTSQPLAYGKVVAPDLSSKVNVSSPLSYTSRQPMTDMIPGKVPSPFCGRPDLSEYTNPDLVANKLSVPTPLSYAATQQELMNKVNYSHPMSELMQSQARYNYPISELMQGKGYQAQISELMQGKSDLYGSRPGEHLLTSQSMYNYSGGRAVVKEAPVKSVAPPKKQTKKSKKAAAAAAAAAGMEAAAASGFQQYQSQAASDAIALKSAASVVPGSAFNFGPAPHSLKDSYASYMDDIRSSGYYVPPQQPPDTTKSTSGVAAPPAPHPTFSFLGNSSRPPYPHPPHPHHPFMNSPYQQYLPRHPEDILRPMVLHQGLLPGPSYPPGYLGIHDPIPRPSWL